MNFLCTFTLIYSFIGFILCAAYDAPAVAGDLQAKGSNVWSLYVREAY